MRSIAALLAAALLALVAPVGLQGAAPNNKKATQARPPQNQPARKQGHHAAHGVVTHVKHDKDGVDGSFVIHTHHQAKGKGGHHHTFRVHPSTTFFIDHNGKHTKASFKRLHKGEHVIVHPHKDRPGVARSVTIVHLKSSTQAARGRATPATTGRTSPKQ